MKLVSLAKTVFSPPVSLHSGIFFLRAVFWFHLGFTLCKNFLHTSMYFGVVSSKDAF